MPGSPCSGSGLATSDNVSSASQVTPLSVDLRECVGWQGVPGLEGRQLAATRGVSSYQVAKRVPASLTERLGCHWALVWAVSVFNCNGALKVTPMSVERM